MKTLPKSDSGQALLLVLLAMAVVLTVVLSVVARSITDLNVTSKEEESLRAFSAAEAGVEQALITGSDVTISSGAALGNASVNAKVTGSTTTTRRFANPNALSSGESGTIWFVNHDVNGNSICNAAGGFPCFTGSNINICWGSVGTSAASLTTPAIEVSIFYESTPGDKSTTKVARATFDPYSTRRTSGVNGDSPNSFSQPTGGSDCTTIGESKYAFSTNLAFGTPGLGIPAGSYGTPNGLQFARIRMFYNTDVTHEFGVTVDNAQPVLPPQGIKIESTGTSGVSNRKVEVFQGYGEPPPIFDAAIFSGSGILK